VALREDPPPPLATSRSASHSTRARSAPAFLSFARQVHARFLAAQRHQVEHRRQHRRMAIRRIVIALASQESTPLRPCTTEPGRPPHGQTLRALMQRSRSQTGTRHNPGYSRGRRPSAQGSWREEQNYTRATPDRKHNVAKWPFYGHKHRWQGTNLTGLAAGKTYNCSHGHRPGGFGNLFLAAGARPAQSIRGSDTRSDDPVPHRRECRRRTSAGSASKPMHFTTRCPR